MQTFDRNTGARSLRLRGRTRLWERPPVVLIGLAAAALIVLVLPVIALLVRAPWSHLVADSSAWAALRLSLVTATAATCVCVVLGVPLAWVLARTSFRGRKFLRALVTVPMVLPPVVAGVALLSAFGRQGLIGRPLFDAAGITIPFSTVAVVIAQAFVALPFLTITAENAFRSVDLTLDEEAATSGATRWQMFWHVNVPLAGPGIAAGAVLAWARAIGEFGATITFAGNSPGITRTMPLAIYTALQNDPAPAIGLSVVLLALSIAVLAAMREKWLTNPQ